MTGNLKPAPFALTPDVVASTIGQRPAGLKLEFLPIEPVKLVDQPTASEIQIRLPIHPVPHCAGQPSSAPSTSTDTAPRSKEAQPAARVDSRSGPVQKQREPQGDGRPKIPSALKSMPVEPVATAESAPVGCDQPDWPDAPLPEEPATLNPVFVSPDDKHVRDIAARRTVKPWTRSKRDALHVQAKDRDARELEAPVDRVARLDLIREAARSAARKAGPALPQRILPGERKTDSFQIPANPILQRRAQVERAIAFLRGKGVLVSIVDRQALVRKYRVTGKPESVLAEDVIQIALERGMTA